MQVPKTLQSQSAFHFVTQLFIGAVVMKQKKTALVGGQSRRTFGVQGYKWKDWGQVITDLRESAKMDQEAFGRLLGGVSRHRISSYERMQAEPPISFWIAVTRRFGLSLSWAFTGTGEAWTGGMEDAPEYRQWEESVAKEEAIRRADEERRKRLFATDEDVWNLMRTVADDEPEEAFPSLPIAPLDDEEGEPFPTVPPTPQEDEVEDIPAEPKPASPRRRQKKGRRKRR